MGDEFRNWTPDDPLNGLPAALLNDTIAMVKWWKRVGSVTRPSETPKAKIHGGLWFQNKTGDAQAQYSIVGKGDMVIAPLASKAYFFGDYVFDTAAPAVGSPFAIVQEPFPDSDTAIAPAKIAGESWCKVSMANGTEAAVGPLAGDYTKLSTISGGSALIIDHRAPDAWDSGTAYVIGDTVENDGLYYTCKADHTNHEPPNGTYWSTRATCWALVDLGSHAPVIGLGIAGDDINIVSSLADTAAWSSLQQYQPGWFVEDGGIPYLSLTSNLNSVPASNPTDWADASAYARTIINIPDASATARGLINTVEQTISGDKTFTDNIIFQDGPSATGNTTLAQGHPTAPLFNISVSALTGTGGIGGVPDAVEVLIGYDGINPWGLELFYNRPNAPPCYRISYYTGDIMSGFTLHTKSGGFDTIAGIEFFGGLFIGGTFAVDGGTF